MIEFSTNEEMVMYIQSLPKGSKEAKKAIAALWAKNIVLVRKIVEQSTKIKYKENGFDDLLQQAYFGFYEAIYKYSTTTGYKFSSYICSRVKWEVNNYSQSRNSGVRIPYYVRIRIRACINKKRELEREYGYFVSDTGEIILLELKYTNGRATSRYAFPTGIMNIIESNGNYFIDENNVLWEVVRNVGKEPTIRKRAENVVWVGYRHYGGGSAYGCVHITSDGTAYKAGTTSKLVLDDESENALPYISRGSFTYSIGGGEYQLLRIFSALPISG